ncbi:MAG: hypothetical protein ACOCUV_00545 [bacterium]
MAIDNDLKEIISFKILLQKIAPDFFAKCKRRYIFKKVKRFGKSKMLVR